jgi:hypothetical protein
MKLSAVAALAAAALTLAAFGGRAAHPVSVVSPLDHGMTCEELQATIAANDSQAAALREEERRAHNGNVAIGVVGVLFVPVVLLALDTSNAQQTEIAARQGRNGYLGGLAAQRCGADVARR